MPSAIDPNFITAAPVSKAGMRDQLAIAKNEITALQDLALTFPKIPTMSTTVGQVITISIAPSSSLTLPAGGTWFYSFAQYLSGAFNQQITNIAPGGTLIIATAANETLGGFAWRIA